MPQKEQTPVTERNASRPIVLVVEKDGQNLNTFVVIPGADLRSLGVDVILNSVLSLEKELIVRISELNARLTAIRGKKQKHTPNPLPASQKNQIVSALRNELAPLSQRWQEVRGAYNAIYGTSQGDTGPARSVVVQRKGNVVSVSVNPYEERQWWSFIGTPQGKEAWTLYSWDKDLFVMLHDGFVLKVNVNRAKFESESTRAEASGAYQEFTAKVEGLRPGAQQALSTHLRSAMGFISRMGI